MTLESLNADFWESLYQRGETRFDMGMPSPPFVELQQSPRHLNVGSMIVLGAGRGHDAIFFAQQGFEVTAVDFAPSAIAAIAQGARHAGVQVTPLQADLFDLPAGLHKAFDYVLEYVCFCAIDPSRRPDYVQAVDQLLRPRGYFLALFFPTDSRMSGPPFPVSIAEVRKLLQAHFDEIWSYDPPSSVKARRGRETLMLWQKRVVDS